MGDFEDAGPISVTPGTELDWSSLRAHHPSALVTELSRLAAGGGRLEFTAADLKGRGNFTTAEVDRLLSELVKAEWLKKRERMVCQGCGEPVSTPLPSDGKCASCGEYFVDCGDPVAEAVFFRQEPIHRLVDWVLTLHGMNTLGAWQEKLSWLVALTYGRTVPVAVYKYGMVRPGVLFRWRQRQLRQQVAKRIRVLSQQAEIAGYNPKPDVIAHSFGTWLLAHALDADDTLKVGRVILTGCILRPDFCWKTLLERQQVEAVLNHCGTADVPVAVTQYFIPDSGPAGRRGFDTPEVINVEESGYGHSTFFRDRLDLCFQKIWQPYLTASDPKALRLPGTKTPAAPWRQARWFLRAGLGRVAVLVVLACLVILATGALIFGIGPFLRWVKSVAV
jgi:hypothetical protein